MRLFIALTFLATIAFVQSQTSDEYVVNEATNKSYKLVYESRTWSAAKLVCERDGAKLAVPKDQEDFQFLQSIVRSMKYKFISGTTYKLLAWLGINNLEDYRVWKNIDGEDIESTGYHTFSGDNGNGFSDNPAEPHCVGIDAMNPGMRSYWCHRQQPYICEKPVDSSV